MKTSIVVLAFLAVFTFAADTVFGQNDVCKDWWVPSTLKDINKVQDDLDTFTPDRDWIVGKYTYDHLLFAVVPSERDLFYTESKAPYKNCPTLVAAYKKVSDTAAIKLPQFVPNKRAYAIQTPAYIKAMHAKITDIQNYKIHYSGVKEPNWLIETNSLGIPTARYKHGLVWVRNTKSTHPYCWIFYINLVQAYAGGGTYGATYGNYVARSMAGCPAGS
jgi:hypothetical protein